MNSRLNTCEIRLIPNEGLFFFTSVILAVTAVGILLCACLPVFFCKPSSPYFR